MAVPVKYYVLWMFIMLLLTSFVSSSTSCSRLKPFVYDLQLQCPTTVMYTWPIEVICVLFVMSC
ncbi:hypothetical protein HanHA300_Chr01g0026591 [Helianthus annuus]|nr:hypothetical protein HanHA300_Chr01g0026591 [Helianthus annuus]KAJ0957802.1 hypothetical protein HanPSC8_Chr01g0031871 [Helianthus annuus]